MNGRIELIPISNHFENIEEQIRFRFKKKSIKNEAIKSKSRKKRWKKGKFRAVNRHVEWSHVTESHPQYSEKRKEK